MNHAYDCGNIDLLDSVLHVGTLLSLECSLQSLRYLRPTLCTWAESYPHKPIAAEFLAAISHGVDGWVG